MTMYEAYIGDIDDFDFDGDGEGNCPGRLSPYFPPTSGDDVFRRVCALNSVQVDWGTYVVAVKKARLLKILEKWYGSHDWYTDPALMPHLYEKLEELKRFVDSLDDKKKYGLVGTEF